jgi:hypothetical protein
VVKEIAVRFAGAAPEPDRVKVNLKIESLTEPVQTVAAVTAGVVDESTTVTAVGDFLGPFANIFMGAKASIADKRTIGRNMYVFWLS